MQSSKPMHLPFFKRLMNTNRRRFRYFLTRLETVKPKGVDKIAKEMDKEVWAETDCLACANCCKTTGPLFTQRDMDRIAKHLGLKTGQFIGKYLYMDEDGDFVLKQVPCAFLGTDNYCSIYEVRPQACREYPHTDHQNFHQILDLTLKNTFICPAAYEVVERLKKVLPM